LPSFTRVWNMICGYFGYLKNHTLKVGECLLIVYGRELSLRLVNRISHNRLW
jgi:hypothetical protein